MIPSHAFFKQKHFFFFAAALALVLAITSARSQEAAFEPPSPLTASTSHLSTETAWRTFSPSV